ncbi:MAG: CoA-binding protein [Candidatus Lokiarchaeota archaeon]|nr:CoA-binding protein [Candidatus Lokiarchaeota archaeon]
MPSPLETILNPRSIAFYGANAAVTTMGTTQLLEIIAAGYPGRIYPIHPSLDSVLGLKAYKSVKDVPAGESIDLAFIVIPAKYVPGVLDECGQRGIKHAVVISAGFREIENQAANDALIEVTRKHGIRFIGPNCIGFYNRNISWVDPAERASKAINTTWIPINPRNGGVSIASQSGTFACHIFLVTPRSNMGINKTISVGNEANIDLVDCLEYLEGDPTTRVIGLYIEEVKRGREFLRVASRVARTKPIVALYVGGTEAGARAGKSHTGALGGNDKVFDAACKQAGIVRAMNMEELLDFCYILDVAPVPPGDRVCILTNAGGPGVNMSDMVERVGMAVPVFSAELQQRLRDKIKIPTAQVRNIVDLTFDIDLELMYRTLPRMLLKSDECDGMLVYGIFGWTFFTMLEKQHPLVKVPVDDLKAIQVELLGHYAKLPHALGKPIIAVALAGREDGAVAILQDLGFPVFEMPHRAVKALWALNERRRALGRINRRGSSGAA